MGFAAAMACAPSAGSQGFFILALVALVLSFALGLNLLRGPISRAVTEATGRELAIEAT